MILTGIAALLCESSIASTSCENVVEFEIRSINQIGGTIDIQVQSDLILFARETAFTFRDLAAINTHEIALSGELYASLDIPCQVLTLRSTPEGESYRAGFRRWWRHNLMLEASLCGVENSDGHQSLSPDNRCCRRSADPYYCPQTDCQVNLTISTNSADLRLSLWFNEMDLTVRYKERGDVRLIPSRRGVMKVSIK